MYAEVDHVLERHPGLRAIFAHFYFLSADLKRAGRFLDEHPNVCLDLTPGSEMYDNFTRNYDGEEGYFAEETTSNADFWWDGRTRIAPQYTDSLKRRRHGADLRIPLLGVRF